MYYPYVLCFESLTIFVLRHSLGNILYKLLQSIYKYFILKQKGFKYLHISEINYEWNYTFIVDIILIWNRFFYIGWLQTPYVVQWCWSHSSKYTSQNMLLPRKIHFLNTGDFLIYFLRHPSRANSRRILIVFY